ncbi:MAG: tRNA (N6-threonylcarbamoyladenosine(37)-N6)-methyltransferase TrmO [Geminicoccaceae bacterium]
MTPKSDFALIPVGHVRTHYQALADCPPTGHQNPDESLIELNEAYAEALQNIELATHLIVLYWFDRADRSALHRRTRSGEIARGVFASRSPNRPNPVAVSVVRLLERDGNRLRIGGLDCLDGTAVIDIKVYDPATDCIPEARLDFDCGCRNAPSQQATEGCKC